MLTMLFEVERDVDRELVLVETFVERRKLAGVQQRAPGRLVHVRVTRRLHDRDALGADRAVLQDRKAQDRLDVHFAGAVEVGFNHRQHAAEIGRAQTARTAARSGAIARSGAVASADR